MSHRAPWQQLRDLEPPLGSKRRVLADIEDELGRPRRGRHLVWLVPLATAVALALDLLAPDSPSTSAATAATATPAATDTAADTDAPIATAPAIRLTHGDSLDLTLADAAVSVVGPAVIRTTDHAVSLDRGHAVVDGAATVRGATCQARVSGRASVTVTDAAMQVRVFAGTAEMTSVSAESSCTVLQAEPADPVPDRPPRVRKRARAPAAAPEPPEPARPPAVGHARQVEPDVPAASELRRQLDAFRAARVLAARDPDAALARYRALRRQWPDMPLREEVDAAIVAVLVELGRTAEARREAEAFGRRHPKSPRVGAMRDVALDIDAR